MSHNELMQKFDHYKRIYAEIKAIKEEEEEYFVQYLRDVDEDNPDCEVNRLFYDYWMDINNQLSFSRWKRLELLEEEFEPLSEYIDNNRKYIKSAPKKVDNSTAPIVCYMVTFTLKPAAKTRWGAAEKMIRNIPNRSGIGFTILEMRMTRETTKAGIKHWHVGLRVQGIVKKDRFLGYMKSFGLVKVDRQWTSDSLDGPMSKYCSKENPFEIIFPVPDKSLS